MGALRIGFEEVGWILSNEEGEFTFTVVIPGWAPHDVAHFFIVFDPYFNPIRRSDVFHVTGPNGTVRREGWIEGLGDRCPTLKGADRVRYVLVGDVSGFSVGADVVVEGTLAEQSHCGERTAIEVVWIQPAG